jgi:hypothetical protein
MNNLRKLLCVLVLTLALGLSYFGQAQACDPGETHTGPPCSAAAPTGADSTDLAQTDTPPAADAVDVVYVFEAALTAMLIL